MSDNIEKLVEDFFKKQEDEKHSEVEKFFSENYGESWKLIPDEEKNIFVNRFLNLKEEEIKEFDFVVDKIKELEGKKFNIIILFLGTILGVTGNLVANLLDRSFSYLGCIYNTFIIIIFIILCTFIYIFFIRKQKKITDKKMNSSEIINIIKDIEKYK